MHSALKFSVFDSRSEAKSVKIAKLPTYHGQALAAKGISAEVINLRTVRPLDRETITQSVKKTKRLVNVEEGWPQCGLGSEISALAMEEFFDYLDAPVERVHGADIPTPYAKSLEDLAFPKQDDIVTVVEQCVARPGKA